MRHSSACVVLLAAVAIGVPAVSATGAAEHSCAGAPCVVAAATPTITAAGVGGVRLGRTYQSLRRAGLLGTVRPGCELGGPRTRSALLRPPLRGSVDLTIGSPRRVASISVGAGAAARGVGIGDRASEIRAAFRQAGARRSGGPLFDLDFVRVPRGGGGPLVFGIDSKTNRVSIIGIPRIPVCE